MANQIYTKITFTRPTTQFPYTKPSKIFDAYIKARYQDTGKLLYKKFTFDTTTTTATLEMTWASDTDRQEFLTDPIYLDFSAEQKEYRIEKNITSVWEQQELDGDNVVRTWSGSGEE